MRGETRVGLPARRITTATTTTTTIAGAHVLHRVIVEAALVGTATFNDGAGTLEVLPAATPAGSYEINQLFGGKLEVVTSAADRLVLVYE